MFVYIIIGILILICILLLSFIYVEIENLRDENSFNVRILSILSINVNILKIFKMFATTKQNRDRILISEVIENTRKSLELTSFTSKLLKEIIILDVDVKVKTSIDDVYYKHIIDTEQWLFLNVLRNILNNKTKNVVKQNYEVINRDDDIPIDYDYDLKLKVRIISIVKVMLLNIKDVKKAIKLFN